MFVRVFVTVCVFFSIEIYPGITVVSVFLFPFFLSREFVLRIVREFRLLAADIKGGVAMH